MSSKDFQIVKRTQKVKQIKPNQNLKQMNKNQVNGKISDSTRMRSQLENRTAQPASTFVSGRELNLTSSTYVRDQNQLPVRAKNNASGRIQNAKVKKTFKYDYKSKNNGQNSRMNLRQVSSVGKNGNQRYKSLEQQSAFQKRFEASQSPQKRRGGPLAIGRGGNFNMKKWAYASKQQLNKIIIIQRWWRYLLKNFKTKGRTSRNKDKSAQFRSKSTNSPKTVDLASFMKQAENITEKIFPTKNNKLIIETRKVEIFKINRPKAKKNAYIKDSKKYQENLKSKKKLAELGGDNIVKRMKEDAYNTIDRERRGEMDKIVKPKRKGEIKIGQDGKGLYGENIQDSRKYGKVKKEGENITDKILPGKENTLINERRKVEDYKLDKDGKSRQDFRISSKDSGRYGTSSIDSKKIRELSKEGEHITDKIFPGKDNTLINERRKVEVFKINKSKGKDELSIDSRERERHTYGQKDSGSKDYANIRKKREGESEKYYPGDKDTLINERRKGDVFKVKGKGKGKGKTCEIKDLSLIEKKAENITEKIFPGHNNSLIIETRKVEVFKSKSPKRRGEQEVRESKKYGESMKDYSQEDSINNFKRKGKRKLRFIEVDGITKKFIKERMRDIWIDESRPSQANKLSILAQGQDRKNFVVGSRGVSSEKKGVIDMRGVSTETTDIDRINNLLSTIKEKDKELNKLVTQLKSQLTQTKTNVYDTHTAGKASTGFKQYGKKGTDIGIGTSTDYETTIKKIINVIKEKDDKLNQLVNEVKNQIGTSTDFYEHEGREFDERGQRISRSRFNVRGLDKRFDSVDSQTRPYIKNVYDSATKTLDEFDTINTQNTYGSDKDYGIGGRNISQIKATKKGYKNTIDTD